MQRSDRKRQTLLVFVGVAILVCGVILWGLYKIFPARFPAWFGTAFAILGGLGGLITVVGALSEIFWPMWNQLKGRDAPHMPKLAESTPIRRVNYDDLVARLGRSGQIPWIDRGVTSAGLLRTHGRVAIVGWMKSGKTREAAELIRVALEGNWISLVHLGVNSSTIKQRAVCQCKST